MVRRRWWRSIAVAAVGLALTGLVAIALRGRAQRDQARLEDRTAARLGFAVTERVQLPAEALQTVSAFVAYAPAIDRATFDAVAASVLTRAPRVYAFEWLPLVTDGERAAVEAQADRDGHPGWVIHDASGAAPAPRRDRYLPILYCYPDSPALGFDALSRPEAAAVFTQACTSGQATVSPRYRLIEDATDRASVLLYVPVWRHGRMPLAVDQRCATVAGAAVVVFRVAEVVSDAIASADRDGLDAVLSDVTAPGAPVPLFESRPGAADRADHGHAVELPMFGRTWRLTVDDPRPVPWPWPAIALGVCLSLLAASATELTVWLTLNRRRLRALTRLGQYRVEGELGRGAMGVVYRARHVLLNRATALKIVSPDAFDAVTRARFEREVRLAARLDHPGIVTVFDFGVTADGLFFYAMELLDGLTLRELVATYGPVPPARSAALIRQIAQALAVAHAQGIVHRDLAPANLMITRRGEDCDLAKVLDFGLVKRLRAVPDDLDGTELETATGVILGTPGFIAPEVLRGHDADERVDIYALGAVWYGLVSGRWPFVGANADAVLRAQLRATPASLTKVVPKLPLDLIELIVDCMQPDPRLRLRSMTDLITRIDALYSYEGSSLSSSPAPSWTSADAKAWWAKHRAVRKASAA